ncbi:GPW/gp25 family protein [Brachymonas chironomi]|uniref:GPW/gp25 family protein n=1 Tax=Brachymonas chironomi TaxID=491919 RepID=UPI0005247140|nr:GPW/gp25 family protein [Brachymonas chironomi]
MDTPVDITTITSTHWQPAIGKPGAVVLDAQDVDQCIRIILSTPKGSDPLRPLFGFDGWQYLDWPVDQARPHLVREIASALAWEPRITVTKVAVEAVDGGDFSHLNAAVTWQFAQDVQGASFISSVTLGRRI